MIRPLPDRQAAIDLRKLSRRLECRRFESELTRWCRALGPRKKVCRLKRRKRHSVRLRLPRVENLLSAGLECISRRDP